MHYGLLLTDIENGFMIFLASLYTTLTIWLEALFIRVEKAS